VAGSLRRCALGTVFVAAVLALGACGSASSSSTTAAAGGAAISALVGVVVDVAGVASLGPALTVLAVALLVLERLLAAVHPPSQF